MITKKLLVGGLNTDITEALVDKSEYIGAFNITNFRSDGKDARVSTSIGNTKLNRTLDASGNVITFTLTNSTTIGAYEDTTRRRVFFFNYDLDGGSIYCYDADDDLIYTVLKSTQVSSGLSFQKDAFIHSIAVIDNLLYWTDGVNPQRKINIKAGIRLNHPTLYTDTTAYTNPVSQSVISLIRNQPWSTLTVSKAYDSLYTNNFIKDDSFQFAYRFVYRDNEVSTISPLSKLLNYNFFSENFNYISITIPTSQFIEQDVASIEVLVKYVVGGNMFVIKTLKPTDPFTFRFYNDSVGIAVDNATAVKPFDSIPTKSETLDIAKNRLFLANNQDGYDTPSTTSLSISTFSTDNSTVSGQWYRLIYLTGSVSTTRYIIYINDINTTNGYYLPASQPTPPTYPTSVSLASLTYVGSNLNEVRSYFSATSVTYLAFVGNTCTITGATVSSIYNKVAFKSDASYKAGIVFYDAAGRKCGVITNDNIKATTPDRTYTPTSYTTQINWSLNNNNAVNQIPVWATHYSVVLTKCLRTSFFFQMKADSVEYISKDSTTGEYTTPTTSYTSTAFGLAIKISSLYSYGLGYQYQDGDLLKLYVSGGSKYTLSVKDQFSNYVIVDLIDLGTTTSTAAVYELFTPYTSDPFEEYYETGYAYQVSNPGQSNRSFTNVSGSFSGDVYILQRDTSPSDYAVEAMSPLDKYWKQWNTNIGRPTIVVSGGVTNKPVSIYWSDVIVEGTSINGLSTFEVTSQKILPSELGQINRLILTSKVQYEGTIMLAVGEQETASLYLGEAQIFDNNGNSFLATTTGVIGNVNVLKGSYGTIHPESVSEWQGAVYFFDANKGRVIKYDINGLTPISEIGMLKYFRTVGSDILASIINSSNYDNANPDYPIRINTITDPYTGEFLIHTPRMHANVQNELLVDMVISEQSIPFSIVADCSLAGVVYLTYYPPPPAPTPTPTVNPDITPPPPTPTPTVTPGVTPEPTPPPPTPTPTPTESDPTPLPSPTPTPPPPTPTPTPNIFMQEPAGINGASWTVRYSSSFTSTDLTIVNPTPFAVGSTSTYNSGPLGISSSGDITISIKKNTNGGTLQDTLNVILYVNNIAVGTMYIDTSFTVGEYSVFKVTHTGISISAGDEIKVELSEG